MSKKIVFIGLILVLVIMAGLFGCAKSAPAPAPTPAPAPATAPSPKPAVIEIKISETVPPETTAITGCFYPWMKEIEQRSNGRVHFTMFAACALGNVVDQYNMLLSGTCDISRMVPDLTPGVFPLTEGISLPMLFNSSSSSSATYMQLVDKYLQKAEYKDVKILWTLSIAPSNVETIKKHVKTLEDFAGQKLIVANKLPVRILQLLGANPIMVPMPEIYTALQTGMGDGVVECWDAAQTFKLVEVTKYRTAVGIWTPATVVPMSLKTWNSLPPDIQKIFEDTSGVAMSRKAGAAFDATEKKVVSEYVAAYDKEHNFPGTYVLPDAERARWTQTLQPIFDEWTAGMEAKGLPAKAFVNDLRQMAEANNKLVAK